MKRPEESGAIVRAQDTPGFFTRSLKLDKQRCARWLSSQWPKSVRRARVRRGIGVSFHSTTRKERVRAQVISYPIITRVGLSEVKPEVETPIDHKNPGAKYCSQPPTTTNDNNKNLQSSLFFLPTGRFGTEPAMLIPVPALVFCRAVLDQLAFSADLSAHRWPCSIRACARARAAPLPAHGRRALATALPAATTTAGAARYILL